jgi:hypothetical protein
MLKYKSMVAENHYGKALVATEDLPIGEVAEVFDGPIVKYEEVPKEKICYVIFIGEADEDKWMISNTNAIYSNHSCNPNCVVDDDLHIVTIKPVKKGEELTYSYNGCIEENEEINDFLWDRRWNFMCRCGSNGCQGMIDGYKEIGPQEIVILNQRRRLKEDKNI